MDLIKLSQRRYNSVVPKDEKIASISKYGRHYLVGGDLLSEAYYLYRNKYNDISLIDLETSKQFILQK